MQRAIPSDDEVDGAVGAGALGSLRRKLRRVAALSAGDGLFVLRAAAWLAAVRVGLHLLSFQRVDALVSRGLPAATRAPDPPRAAQLAELLDIAARHALPPVTCLPRALVLRRLLRCAGLPAELHIGALWTGRDGLHAHAWVTSGAAVVGDAPDIAERFAELVSGADYLAALAEASRGRSEEGNHQSA